MKNILILIIILWIAGCSKDADSPIPRTYDITYFVNCDSAYIEYNVVDSNYNQYISNWDTTFSSHGGWVINIMVYGFSEPFVTGLIIDGDTVDGCLCGNWCLMGQYLN